MVRMNLIIFFNRQLINDTIQISQGNVFKIGKLNINVQLYLDDH